MKKHLIPRIALFAAILLCLVSLVSCGDNAEIPNGYKEISDEGVTYHFYVPQSWTADISTGMTSAYYSTSDPSSISVTAFELTNEILSAEAPVLAYWESQQADFKAVFPDMEIVSSEERTLDDVAAMQYVFTGSQGGITYRFLQVIAMRNAQIYIITYTATTTNYDAHTDEVSSMIDAFKFKNDGLF